MAQQCNNTVRNVKHMYCRGVDYIYVRIVLASPDGARRTVQ